MDHNQTGSTVEIDSPAKAQYAERMDEALGTNVPITRDGDVGVDLVELKGARARVAAAPYIAGEGSQHKGEEMTPVFLEEGGALVSLPSSKLRRPRRRTFCAYNQAARARWDDIFGSQN